MKSSAQKAVDVDYTRRWRAAHPDFSKKYYAANRAILTRRTREWKAVNFDKVSAYHGKSRERMASRSRPDKCEACDRRGPVCFDHCHESGKFRGWLCRRCNFALGYVNDSRHALRALVKYFETAKLGGVVYRGNSLHLKERVGGRRPEQCQACGKGGDICFDHCHKSGKFRGWLCRGCNAAAGCAGDSASTLRKLAAYLEAAR